MKKQILIVFGVIIIFSCYSLYAGSILVPFWQDDNTPIYSYIVVHNTSQVTADDIDVMFYGKTGNPQVGAPFERTIPPANMELFGTRSTWPGLMPPTGDPYGYAIVSGTGGMLIAVGIIYDANANCGYPIPCFQGDDNLKAVSGW